MRVPEWYGRTERPEKMPPDIEEVIENIATKSGFVPNVFTALAHMPEEFRSFFGFHDNLMGDTSDLTKAEKEMIVVVTSAANHCTYCVIAHGAILRIRAKDSTISDLLCIDYRLAGVPERQMAILDFATKVASAANTIEEADFEPLYRVGLGDREIWEIGAITAFFAMSNRIAGFARILPNKEFHTLGR